MTVATQLWFAVADGDDRARALYLRHYSHKRYRQRRPGGLFCGPGERMVLMTPDSRALFVWKLERHRKDGQVGVTCSIFRNEGTQLSSELIREAMALAWERWPQERLFTYVWDAKIASVNPGYCFKQAGWRTCGRNKDGRLTILEALPA